MERLVKQVMPGVSIDFSAFLANDQNSIFEVAEYVRNIPRNLKFYVSNLSNFIGKRSLFF